MAKSKGAAGASNEPGSEVVTSSGIVECSSPPCMMHEFDPEFVKHTERLTEATPAHDWEEIRLWRKAKRTVLIVRRLAIPGIDRAGHKEAITAILTDVLASYTPVC